MISIELNLLQPIFTCASAVIDHSGVCGISIMQLFTDMILLLFCFRSLFHNLQNFCRKTMSRLNRSLDCERKTNARLGALSQ